MKQLLIGVLLGAVLASVVPVRADDTSNTYRIVTSLERIARALEKCK